MTPYNGKVERVKVLVEGRIVRNGAVVLDASSTVTLVQSGQMRMIVDTGAPSDIPFLMEALNAERISPAEVDFVVNTHLHLDHVGGNGLFTNARFYAHMLEMPPIGVFKVSEEIEVLPGVRLLPTPGHTAGCISVLVRADKRYAICGDAIPTKANYENHVPPLININPWLALKSLDALVASAEIIIPGHEAPFQVTGKK